MAATIIATDDDFDGKPAGREPGKRQRQSIKPKTDFQLILEDKRTQFTFYVVEFVLAFFTLIACFSYLLTGRDDQSIVMGTQKQGYNQIAQEVDNFFGLGGAHISHFLMYTGFGLGIYFALCIPIVHSIKLVFKLEQLNMRAVINFCLFWTLWLSSVFGFVFLVSPLDTSYTFLGGSVGYEISALLFGLLGWAYPVVLFAALVIHGIWYFDLVSWGAKWSQYQQARQDKARARTATPPIQGSPIPEFEPYGPIRRKSTAFPDSEEVQDETPDATEPTDHLTTDAEDAEGFDLETTQEVEQASKAKSKEPADPFFEIIKAPTLANDPIVQGLDEGVISFEAVPKFEEKKATEVENYDPTLDLSTYQNPVLALLNEPTIQNLEVDQEELSANKDRILETLRNYGVGIASIKATIGPTVTLYEIVPDQGVRVSKIKNLEDDIALSLAALGIRIIAPMPGRGTIGIEVPNKRRETVYLKSVLSTEKFMRSSMDLPIVLGKSISNEVMVFDLAKMPHLLMAGATGQGKSVGINILLTSLLFKKHPSQLKLVLVDPKKVELSVYSKIERHFLAKLPGDDEAIITDTSKVVHTLNSLCEEMDARYLLLKDAGCRNIKEYNQKFIERKLLPTAGHKFLPYIVLIIDELADLMMTAGKEVETPIARLAQLARAIGIHLVVATQRPSVNVITGLIKANFPARLSFKVTSKTDSRTILDTGGADQLVGQGDMLLSMGSDIVRLQCPFVDTPEVERICDFIAEQRGYPNAYELPVIESMLEGDSLDFDPADIDPLFADAARIIVNLQQGSTSHLQRKLKLGYNRAGRLMDQLEQFGIVGPSQGSKPRDVLIDTPDFLEMRLKELGF